MDLLGDLGDKDQLVAARTENQVLQKRVKELAARVKVLTVENESLKAEVEEYRALSGVTEHSSTFNGGVNFNEPSSIVAPIHFQSGNGNYCKLVDLELRDLHGSSNLLCVSMSGDTTVLATGGADHCLRLSQWGAANMESHTIDERYTRCIDGSAPVISVACHAKLRLVAAGRMDGSVVVVWYDSNLQLLDQKQTPLTHTKYVKSLSWMDDHRLATASADGNVHVYDVQAKATLDDTNNLQVTHVKSLHFENSVECLTPFHGKLYLYVRDTPGLTVVQVNDDNYATELIRWSDTTQHATGGFDDHVSFSVLDLAVSSEYLCCATDNNRHIVLDTSNRQVRNLYGHEADGFSTPSVAWNPSSQYLYCNNQNSTELLVYEIASATVVDKLSHHTRPIKAVIAKNDILVTVSFDRKVIFWKAHE